MITTAIRRALGPLIVVLALPAVARPLLDEPFVDLPLEDARARAEAEDRLLLLFFHNPEDPESRRMLNTTYADGQVRDWIRTNAIAVLVDAGDLAAKQRYGVSTFPMTLILGKDGKLLHKMEYHRDAPDLLIAANSAKLALGNVLRPDGDQIENPMAWLAWGNWLFNNDQKRAEEALDAYLWCLDHGEEHIQGFRERHLEFLLERVAYLKPLTNQRAVQAMWDRRVVLRTRILTGQSTPRDLHEYLRFSFWLRDELDTVAVFDELGGLEDEAQRASREALMRDQLQLITAWKRFEDILQIEQHPFEHIQARLKAWEAKAAESGGSPDTDERAKIVDDAACYFEALAATGHAGDAMELYEITVAAAPSGRAYRSFIERTNRIELYNLSRKIGEDGLAAIHDKGRRLIELELRRIPGEGKEKSDEGGSEKQGDGEGGDQR